MAASRAMLTAGPRSAWGVEVMGEEQGRRKRMSELVHAVQNEVCAAVTALDGSQFREDVWERPGGGGGWSRVLEGGPIIEKGGVNVSAVHGVLPPEAAKAMRVRRTELPPEPVFFATGISLVLHPRSPRVPTVHANFRYLDVSGGGWWFGGGADLTPWLYDEADATHFHSVWKSTCDRHDVGFYPTFKATCDRYFHLAHRGETRGVGGIFFDDLEGDFDRSFGFVADCARSVVAAWLPIAERRRNVPTDEADRLWQLRRRSRYAEFNLVYDRGTTFGLKTDARVESVLMSMPPLCRWDVDVVPRAGTDEERLVEVLRKPREWAR